MDKKRKKQIQIQIQIPQALQTSQLINTLTYKPPYDSSWFETENKVSLDTYIKHLFSLSKEYLKSNVHPDTIKGLFVPHDGIKKSGLCAASAYTQLLGRTQPIKRIILLCTNHESSNSFISTTYNDILSYNTNTNTNNKSLLKIDTNTIEYLKPYLKIDNNKFNNEHSFFNQLPFIEYIISQSSNLNTLIQDPTIKNNKNALLLPFLISNNINLLDENTRNNIRHILHTIIDLLKHSDTILLCTSDLSHINGHFETKINSNIYQNIRKKDNEILQFLYNGVNGLNERNQKIDDILFIANAPSCGTLAIYFFAKILHNYSGSLDYSSSTSSSSNSSGSKSPTANNNINNINNIPWINKKDIKDLNTLLNKIKQINKINKINKLTPLLPRVCCYYTSLMRNKININNFNPLELNTVLNIIDNSESSISYAGIIFTTQPYIELNKIKKLENIFSEYEKISLKGLVREQLYKQLDLYNMSKIPSHLLTTVNCSVFTYNLGLHLTIYKNNKLRSCIGTNNNYNENFYENDDFSLLNKIKKFTNELTLHKTNYKDLEFTIIEPIEINSLSFNIDII